MRWSESLRTTTALLCQIYLTMVGSLVLWAIFPLFLGWTPTVVVSGSMEPRISVGDIIFADPMDTDEVIHTVKRKNVLLAEDPNKPGRLVTHRVVEIINGGNSYITKGDANVSNDSTPIPAKNVLGIEKLRVPYIGIPIYAMQTGNFAVPGLFVISLIASQLLVRKQWQIESEASKSKKAAGIEPEKIEQEGSFMESFSTMADHPVTTKSKFWGRGIAMIAVPLFILFSSLMMSSSAATWKGEKSNSSNTFEACFVFKKNENQNTSGPNCGNNGNE